MPTRHEDKLALRELVAGDWERFATVWDPADGWMTATWFQGPATQFIEVSKAAFESGVSGRRRRRGRRRVHRPLLRLLPPPRHRVEDRVPAADL